MSTGEFYKVQQKLHLLGNIMSDRDELGVLCVSDHHCTHLPHGDQLSLILSWTGPQHLLHMRGQFGHALVLLMLE